MTLYIIIGVLVLIVLIFIIINNQIIGKKNKVKEAFGSIDVYLKKRFDLIPNLISVVNKYASHEKELLTTMTKLRSNIDTSNSTSEMIDISNQLTSMLSGLNVTVENYPDLKADSQFLNLQHNLTDTEEQISAARRSYNAAVTTYNDKIQMFPASLVAGIRGDKSEIILETISEEKENINVDEMLK